MRQILRSASILSALVVALALPAFAGDASDFAGRIATWEQAYNDGDTAALAAHYTEDCKRMPYQEPIVSGRDAVAAQMDVFRERGAVTIELGLTEAESRGDMAWGAGTYKLMDSEGNVLQTGKWMNVSVKVGKHWLTHRDIWNTDAPDE